MLIREILKEQDEIEKFYQKQQAQELKKKKTDALKKVSYFVKIHIHPDLKNTVSVYWLTPDQLHYTYEDALREGQVEKLSAKNTIQEFSTLIYDRLGNFFAPKLDRRRIQVHIPADLQKYSPEFYNGVKEWESRSQLSTNQLVSFKTVPAVVNEPVKKPSAKVSSPSASSGSSIIDMPKPEEVAQMFKKVFMSDPALRQLLSKKRNPKVDKDINGIIADNWGEDLALISDEVRDYLTSI
jgi:hypothetical protein